MLSLNNFTVEIDRPLFSPVSIDFAPGEIIHLTGKNGAGKTQMLRALSGCLPGIYRGSISGDLIHTHSSFRMRKALTGPWAAPRLFTQRVKEEIENSLTIDKSELDNILDNLELKRLLDRHPQKLSGGEQQRVLLASYLACNPDILLLDEPFSHISDDFKDNLSSLLFELSKKNKLIIIADHNIPENLKAKSKSLMLQVHRERLQKIQESKISSSELAEYYNLPDTVSVMKAESIEKNSGDKMLLSSVNFKADKGDFIHLNGKNGSGKTTLYRIITRLDKNFRGTVYLNGSDNNNMNGGEISGIVSYVQQNSEPAFFCSSVYKEIYFGADKLGKTDREYINTLLDYMGLKKHLSSSPFSLSEGEKKRLQVCIALAVKPQLLLLDEADAGLDSIWLEKLLKLLKELNRKGLAVIFSTHSRSFRRKLKSVISREINLNEI